MFLRVYNAAAQRQPFKDAVAETESFLVGIAQITHCRTQAVKPGTGTFISFRVLTFDHKVGKICKTFNRSDDLHFENGKNTKSQQNQECDQPEANPVIAHGSELKTVKIKPQNTAAATSTPI